MSENAIQSTGGLAEVRRDWTRLGSEAPLWAVCVDPEKRNGGWDDDEFLASGAAEVEAALGRLGALGLHPGRDRALDFGCGAGRLSNALARHFARVDGVDVSAPMLAEARRLDRSGGRISFHLNEAPDLAAFGDATFDLVYTDLVLQHLPPELAAHYLAEFTRVVRPGGAMVLGVPARERATLKGLVFRWAPWPLIRFAQRRLLGYPAPMRMHTWPAERIAAALAAGSGADGAGAPQIAASDEYWGGDHWVHLRHSVSVPAADADTAGEDGTAGTRRGGK